MKVQYRQFQDETNLPLIRAGVDLLGQGDLTVRDADCLNSFNGAIDWKQVSSETGVQGSEIVFCVDDSRLIVSLLETDNQGKLGCHELEVKATTPDFCNPLSGLLHTVLAPAFTPGLVGVDWEDVKVVLRSGRQGQLALVAGNLESAIADAINHCSDRLVRGVLAVIFLPEEQFSLPLYREATRLLQGQFGPSVTTLVAAPVLTQGELMFGLLVVYD